jgi:hypothetical protein
MLLVCVQLRGYCAASLVGVQWCFRTGPCSSAVQMATSPEPPHRSPHSDPHTHGTLTLTSGSGGGTHLEVYHDLEEVEGVRFGSKF